MAKTYKKKYTRRVARRKFSRRPYKKRFNKKSDGTVLRIIKRSINLVSDGAGNSLMRVYWGRTQTAPASILDISLHGDPEWIAFRNMFSQYKITGCKIKYHPVNLQSSNGTLYSIRDVMSSSDTRPVGVPY